MYRHRIALLLAISTFPSVGNALEPREVFKLAEPSIVVVLASDAKGNNNVQTSGVLIAALDVLTSCKGVADSADIVVTQAGALRPATVRHADLERDLCQLRLREPLPAARIAQSDTSAPLPQIGDDVYLVSSPRGLDRTFSRVMLSGLREVPGSSARLFQLNDSPEPGSFGGGVFDQQGRLLGILTPQFRRSGKESLAIPLAWTAELVTRAPERIRVAAPQAAAEPAPAAGVTASDARWHPAKGNRWRYRLIDGKRAVGTVNVEVIESGGGRVRERITREGSAGFTAEREVSPDLTTNAFQPALTLPGGYTFLELSSYFPPGSTLAPGTSLGQIPGEMYLLVLGKRNLVWTTRVAGIERVRVPAGEFEAWRIEATSQDVGPHGPLKIRYRIWYSADMQRPIKIFLAFDTRIDIANSSETLELAAFENISK
jgi:serine protease Do